MNNIFIKRGKSMEDKKEIVVTKEEIIRPIRIKFRIFLFTAIGLVAFAILMVLIVAIGGSSEEMVAEYGSPVGACVAVGVVLTIPAIVLGILAIIHYRKMKNEDYVEKKRQEVQQNKQRKEEVAEENKAKVSPDFEPTKTFQSGYAQIWLNHHTKQIQFLLPELEKDVPVSKIMDFFFGKTKLFKTKVLNLDDLKDISIEENVEEVKEIRGSGGRMEGDYADYGSGRANIKVQTIRYYTLMMKFNDIDYPIIRVYFNNNKTTPETCRETINIILNGKFGE